MAHVLLIDDDEVTGELLATVLADGGHTSERAASAERASPLRAPDLIVADLVGLDRFHADAARALVRRVRGEFRAAPVVVCTAHAEAARTEIGADAVIAKPFDVDALLAAVERLTRDRV